MYRWKLTWIEDGKEQSSLHYSLKAALEMVAYLEAEGDHIRDIELSQVRKMVCCGHVSWEVE